MQTPMPPVLGIVSYLYGDKAFVVVGALGFNDIIFKIILHIIISYDKP